jgi:hypothetical protein
MTRSHKYPWWKLVAAFCLMLAPVVGGVAAILFLIPFPAYGEIESPDGAFLAVATSPLIAKLMPIMPGQSGDRSGWITVYRKDGQSCGSAPVDMVYMIDDLRWELSKSPREVSLVAGARWDLDACTVEVDPE